MIGIPRTQGIALAASMTLVAFAARAQDASPRPLHIEDGDLDSIDLKVETIAAEAPVVIKLFPADKANLGTGAEGGKEQRVAVAKKIQQDGPQLLADAFIAQLKGMGPYTDVRLDDGSPIPPGALVVEGEFIQLDPGSRAKRYWVGFGAGKSGTTVKGTVKDGSGRVLAEFQQKRIAVIGMFGGDYEAKMRSDCKSIGEDIAKFLSHWASGKPLKKGSSSRPEQASPSE